MYSTNGTSNSVDINSRIRASKRIWHLSRLYVVLVALFLCTIAGFTTTIQANAAQPDSFTGTCYLEATNRNVHPMQAKATIVLPNGSRVVATGHCISGIAYAQPYNGNYSYKAVHVGNGRYRVTIYSHVSKPYNASVFKPGKMKGVQDFGEFYVTYLVQGSLDLQKASDNTSITNGNANYSLEGARYGIWHNDFSGTGRAFVTNKNGYAKLDGFAAGWYWVHELNAPKGYQLDTTHGQHNNAAGHDDNGWYHIEVVAGETRRINSKVMYDTPRIGKITVQKKDAVTDSDVSKAGFKFQLLASDKKTVIRKESASDDNGQVTFENLGFGTYYVQETAAVSPYALNSDPVAVSVSDDGSTSVKAFVTSIPDKMCYGNAEIKKIDNVKSSLIPGVGYNVVAQEDIDRPDGTIMYHKNDVVQHLVTGDDGTATTKDGVEDNRLYIGADGDGKYAFIETNVPAPLTIDKTPIPFTIAYAGDNAEKIDTVHATQVNNVSYGAASIHKTDNVLNEAIPNTTYDVKATQDITLWNGTVIYKKGEKVDSLITDKDGKASTTTRLYVGSDGNGSYSLTETSVPTGAVIKRDPIPFTITYQNENVEILGTAELSQVNNIAYGSASIHKTDNVKNSDVQYAEYDVIAAEDITLWNGHRIYKKNQVIEHVTTGKDGIANTSARYYVGSDGDGKYEFVETAVKAPMLLNATPIPFTITYKNESTEVLDKQNVNQTDSVPYTSAEIKKTDNVLNSGVPDVEYDVKALEDINLSNCTIYKKGQVIGHIKTDSDGTAKTDDSIKLYPGITGVGRYAFVETKVPVGLTINSTPVEFTVKYKNENTAALNTISVSQVDCVVYGGASIRKTETTNGTNIHDAKFDVVADEDIVLWNGKTIYRKDDIVDQITSNSDGVATTSKPLYVGSSGVGHYRFVETFTPCPYFNDRIDVPFTVNYVDNKTENVRIEESAQKEKGNGMQSLEVHFSKTDFSSGAPVAGAVFELSANVDVKTQSGSVVYRKDKVIGTYTTDEDGSINVKGDTILVDASGECSYKFVEVKAPAGYVLDSTPVNFTVKYVGQDVDVQYGDDISVTNKPNTFKLTKTVTSKDIDSGVTDTTVPNATYRVWRKADELPVNVDNNSDSYALRIDNGDMNRNVSVSMISDKSQATINDKSNDNYSVVLTDEQGNVITVKNSDKADIELKPSRYTVSLVDSNGSTVSSFDGDKHIDLKSGKKATFTITSDDKNDDIKVTTKMSDVDDLTANVEKRSGAYVATGLKLNTEYQVEVDGEVVYTFTTSDDGGRIYYGRYDSNASDYAYKRQPMLLTDDSKFIDKFTVNGKDYPVQTKVDTDGNISFTHITPGSYGIGETDVPVLGDELLGSSESYLVNTGVCYFTVDETTGRINDVNDFRTSSENDYTVVTLSKVEITGGPEIPGAQLEVQKPNGDVVDSWTSTDKPHIISRLTPGKYSLVERMTPNRYDQSTRVDFEVKDTGEVQHVEMVDKPIEINARLDKRQEIAKPVVSDVSPNGDGKNRANAKDNDDGAFEYSLDYESTSNTWTDEFTVYDPLDGVNDGLARLDYITTAQCSNDYDGKMNVWYKTNKTPSDYKDDATKANATIDDGHVNPWITGDTRGDDSKKNDSDGDGRIADYTGWRLWAKNISTLTASKLNVSDLGLAQDEYVTALRFEYGRVDKGFTTRTSAWDRNDLKEEHDDLDSVAYIRNESFKETSLNLKKSVINTFMLALNSKDDSSDSNSDSSADDTSDDIKQALSEEDLLSERITEAIDANDEDTINELIPSVKKLVTKYIDSLLSSLDSSDTDSVKETINDVSSAYDKFASTVSDSDNKKVEEAIKKIKNDVESDDTQATNLLGDVKTLTTAINAAIEAIDVHESDVSIKYAPAIIGMHVTDKYVPGTNLTNSAYVDAYRNGSGDKLQGHDNDKVTQTPKQEYGDVAAVLINNDLVQTGINNLQYIVLGIGAVTVIIIGIRRRRN